MQAASQLQLPAAAVRRAECRTWAHVSSLVGMWLLWHRIRTVHLRDRGPHGSERVQRQLHPVRAHVRDQAIACACRAIDQEQDQNNRPNAACCDKFAQELGFHTLSQTRPTSQFWTQNWARPLAAAPSTARPSYSSCASDMVRTPPKPSRCDASCCRVDVVNGAAGLRVESCEGKTSARQPFAASKQVSESKHGWCASSHHLITGSAINMAMLMAPAA